MKNSLKALIIGSLVILLGGSIAIGIYVLKMGTKDNTVQTTTTASSKSNTEKNTATEAKAGEVKTIQVTPDMINANGTIDFSKADH